MTQGQVLPADVQQIAQSNQLGALRAEYDYEISGRLITGVLCVVAGLVTIILIISGHIFGGFILPGPLLIPYGIYVLIDVYRNSRTRVLLFEQGIIKFQAERPSVVRWDQVDTFQEFQSRSYSGGRSVGSRGRIIYSYRICRSDGRLFDIGSTIRNVEVLGRVMQQDIADVLLPRYIDTYKAGDTLTFGPLTVNQQGLGAKKYLLPWHEFKSIERADNNILVWKVDQLSAWLATSADKVPNYYILIALIKNIKYANNGKT